MAQISDLPTEIVQHIFSLLHPSSIVNFACTCRSIHDLGTASTNLHRERLYKYHEVSDLYSSTVPNLLLEINQDPRVAWYVRRFVVFQHRNKWEEWAPFDKAADEDDRHNSAYGGSDSPIPVWHRQMPHEDPNLVLSERLRKNIRDTLDQTGIDFHTLLAIDSIDSGGDLYLKVALLAQTNNLQTLIVTAHEAPGEKSIVDCLTFAFCNFMDNDGRKKARSATISWLPSLSKVYLNQRTIEQESQTYQNYMATADWTPFLLIPSIRTLSVQVGFENDDQERFAWSSYFNPQSSSSLQHLDLDFFPVSKSEIPEIVNNITALKSFTIDGDYFDPLMDEEAENVDVLSLLQRHGSTLEAVRFGSWDYNYTIPFMKGFTALCELRLNVWHLFHGDPEHNNCDALPPSLVDLVLTLPPSLEILKLFGSVSTPDTWPCVLEPFQAEILARGLVALAEARVEGRTSVRAMCTRDVCMVAQQGDLCKHSDQPGFQSEEVRAACDANGLIWSHWGQDSECAVCERRGHVISDDLDWVGAKCEMNEGGWD